MICYLCVLVCLRLCVLETKKKKESCQFFFSSILRKARRSFPFFFATEEHKKKGVFSFVNRKKGSNKNKLFGSSCRRRPPLFLSCSVCVKACQLHLFRFQNRHALNVEDKLGQCARWFKDPQQPRLKVSVKRKHANNYKKAKKKRKEKKRKRNTSALSAPLQNVKSTLKVWQQLFCVYRCLRWIGCERFHTIQVWSLTCAVNYWERCFFFFPFFFFVLRWKEDKDVCDLRTTSQWVVVTKWGSKRDDKLCQRDVKTTGHRAESCKEEPIYIDVYVIISLSGEPRKEKEKKARVCFF